MKTRRTLAAVGVASALALSTALTPVLAAETKSEAATPQQQQPANAAGQQSAASQQTPADGKALLRTSQEVANALKGVRAARVAIFNGAPDEAKTFLASLAKDLDAARSAAGDIAIAPARSDAAPDRYVPFDVSMALAEGFQPTEEKVATLKEAHAQMTSGDQKQAAEVLKLADIDVTVSAALLPLDGTAQNVADATKLMDAGQYYEANLALKKIEDSVLVESYALTGMPTQGTAG